MTSEAEIREIAATYTARGWRVFPVDDQKRPRTAHGFKDASLDPEQFTDKDGIGIATGQLSGLVVVDLDEKNGVHGIEEFKKLMQGHPDITTRTVKTPTGGAHLYFNYTGILKTRINHPAPGIDFKAEGGYVVAPPSVLKNGECYAVVKEVELADLPDWLIEVFTAPDRDAQPKPPHTTSTTITAGGRNDVLFKMAASLRGKKLTERAILAALRAENQERCSPPLSEEEIVRIAASVGKYPPGNTPQLTPPDPVTLQRASEIYNGGKFVDYCKERFADVWLGDQHILEGVLYCAANMRVLNAKDAIHIHVSGSTQTGKSDGIKTALRFIHPNNQQTKTFSPMYLFHASKNGDLHENMMIFTDDTILDPDIAALYRNVLTSYFTGVERGTVTNNEPKNLHIPARVSLILTSIDSMVSQSEEGQDESRFLTLEVRRTPDQMIAIRKFIQEQHPDLKNEHGLICAIWDLVTPREITIHKTIEKDLPIREFKRFLTLCQDRAILFDRDATKDEDFDAIEKFLSYSKPMIDSSTAAFTRAEAAVMGVLSEKVMTIAELIEATGMSRLRVYRAIRGRDGNFQNPSGGLMAKEPRLDYKEERSEFYNAYHTFRLRGYK